MDTVAYGTDLLLTRILALFRQTFDENLVLQRRVIELERELSVWKLALAKADEDSATLKSSNTHLQQIFNSLKVGLLTSRT